MKDYTLIVLYYDDHYICIRLNKKLSELERKHGIISRWSITDPEAKRAHGKEMQRRLRASLWATITRRQYLLKMKAKYAGKKDVIMN